MFRLGLAFIWIVTAYDIWCCQWLTPSGELNPIARLVLIYGGVWTLVSLKVIGTFLVTETLRSLHWGYLCAIVGVQAATLSFLVFA